MRAHGLIAWATFLVIPVLGGCGATTPSPSPNTKPTAYPATAIAAASVELTSQQRESLRIEAVGSRSFPLTFAAIGSVSLEEDAGIVEAESTLLAAEATRDAAHRELARVSALGEANGIPAKELESARAADLAAAAAVTAAREAVRALGVPDGEVDASIRAGRFAAAGASGNQSWVLINVPESATARLHVGERIRASVLAYPDVVFHGRVARIYATLDPASHRMALRASVEDPGHRLRPGMLADVEIEYGSPVDGLAIPMTAAVRESDGRMVAWTTTDRAHFLSRPLSLGRQDDGHYQVLSGLKPGELVVTEGGIFLSNLLEAPPSD